MKSNHPTVLREKFDQELLDKSEVWNPAKVQVKISDAVRWAMRQLEHNPNAFRDTWPVDAKITRDEFISLIGDIKLPPNLSTQYSDIKTFYDIIVRWFSYIKHADRIPIFILHGALISMRKIGERFGGMTNVRIARRYASAVKNIVYYLNHPDAHKKP